jgi:putative endopeptidase
MIKPLVLAIYSKAQEDVKKAIIVLQDFATGSDEKLGLYDAFMDTKMRDQKELKSHFYCHKKIDAITNYTDLAAYFDMQTLRKHIPFSVSGDGGFKRSNPVYAYFRQGGLGLPDREYYAFEANLKEIQRNM